MFAGKKVREMRKKAGLTMAELGKKIGISEAYVSMLETGKRECPDGKVLYLIAKTLNCLPSDLTDNTIMLAFAKSFQASAEAPPKPTITRKIPAEPPETPERVQHYIETAKEEVMARVKVLQQDNEALRKRVEMLEAAFKLIPKVG